MKFNNNARAFSKINLAYLSYCSNLVYENKSTIETELKRLNFNLLNDSFYFSNSDTDTQAFVVGDDRKIIVSFRGTEGKIADWASNIKLRKKAWTVENPLGTVHEGFYEGLFSIWTNVYEEVVRLRNNSQSIWITGHSLGGALATLAAATFELQSPNLSISGLYTFGQPRVGDSVFSKNYNNKLKSNTFRIVNNNDVVTRVPPQILGYSHVGKLMYFDSDGHIHYDGSLSWWAKFWDRLEGRFENILDLTPDGIDDHSIDLYQQLSESQT